MTHVEIVKKLIGKINPIGETNTDNTRFDNLKEMCKLVDELFYSIACVASDNKDAEEFSVKRAAKFAQEFINDIKTNQP